MPCSGWYQSRQEYLCVYRQCIYVDIHTCMYVFNFLKRGTTVKSRTQNILILIQEVIFEVPFSSFCNEVLSFQMLNNRNHSVMETNLWNFTNWNLSFTPDRICPQPASTSMLCLKHSPGQLVLALCSCPASCGPQGQLRANSRYGVLWGEWVLPARPKRCKRPKRCSCAPTLTAGWIRWVSALEQI